MTTLNDLISGNLATLGAITANGECRLMKLSSPGATSEQGFLVTTREPRFEAFWPCSWSIKTEKNIDADERSIASQPRSTIRYEITLLRSIERTTVEAMSDDRLQLRRTVGCDDTITLEITAVVPQQDGAYLIQAIDTNAA